MKFLPSRNFWLKFLNFLGEQQIISFVRLLESWHCWDKQKYHIVVLDEATSSMSKKAKMKFMKLICEKMKQIRGTIICVSHDDDYQSVFRKKLAILGDGQWRIE